MHQKWIQSLLAALLLAAFGPLMIGGCGPEKCPADLNFGPGDECGGDGPVCGFADDTCAVSFQCKGGTWHFGATRCYIACDPMGDPFNIDPACSNTNPPNTGDPCTQAVSCCYTCGDTDVTAQCDGTSWQVSGGEACKEP